MKTIIVSKQEYQRYQLLEQDSLCRMKKVKLLNDQDREKLINELVSDPEKHLGPYTIYSPEEPDNKRVNIYLSLLQAEKENAREYPEDQKPSFLVFDPYDKNTALEEKPRLILYVNNNRIKSNLRFIVYGTDIHRPLMEATRRDIFNQLLFFYIRENYYKITTTNL